MATKATVTKPANIIAVHAPHTTTGDYHRFEPNINDCNLQKPGTDDSAFNTTTITFSISGNNVTATLPSGMRDVHVITSNEHYYRFNNGLAVTVAPGDASLFANISFTVS